MKSAFSGIDIGVLLCKVAEKSHQKKSDEMTWAEARTCTDIPDILKRQLKDATAGATKTTPTLRTKKSNFEGL